MSDSRSASPTATGGCLCGAVRFEISAAPAMTAMCYCQTCRKTSGAGHAFNALVPADAMKIRGETRGYDSKADSGNTVTTSFCPTCGSPLFGKSSGFPGMVMVRVASFDDPNGVTPQMAVYTKRLLNWDHLDPSVKSFAAMPPAPGKG